MSDSLVEMAKDLAMAQIQAGHLTADQLSTALAETHATLQRLNATGGTHPDQVATSAPITWRQSITRHVITCLECGATFRQLSTRHLRHHDLDGRTYRQKYGIPRTVSLSARDVLARRRELVQAIRPWEKSPTNRKSDKPAAKTAPSKTQPKAKASAKTTAKASAKAKPKERSGTAAKSKAK